MIIDCVADLHGCKPQLDGGDLLIVAGDLTAAHTDKQFEEFLDWMRPLNYEQKVFIGGNHDTMLRETNRHGRLFGDGICYLLDWGLEFQGKKIFGSPWTSQFPGINPMCTAFTYPFMKTLKDKWDLIPNDVDILITHGPPHGIFDQVATEYNASVGDMYLRQLLEERIKPQLHVFGHIHEGGGKQMVLKRPGHGTENNTICVNASVVDERYRHVNKPVRITL